MPRFGLRKVFSVATAIVLVSAVGGCSGGDDDSSATIKIGALVPMSGIYEDSGTDIRDAFEIYIESHEEQLGGHPVEVVIRDQGEKPKAAAASADRMVNQDKVDVLIGGLNSIGYLAAAPIASKAKVPFIGIGGKPDLTDVDVDEKYLWQTSYQPAHAGLAIAPYLAETVDGPVYAIGPDYKNGAPQHKLLLESFTKPYTEMGGKLANPNGEIEWIPFPKAPKDLSSYFDDIASSGAKAIYTYNGGPPAEQFVTQWAESSASDIPLYGAFITEGPSLVNEGKAAEGVRTVMNYSPTIDNAANRTFVAEWNVEHSDRPTNTYNLTGWDSGLVLDRAFSRLGGDTSGEDINEALTELGVIESPRGSWQFTEETQTPVQKWYLREVESDGPQLTNVVTDDLATLGDDPQ